MLRFLTQKYNTLMFKYDVEFYVQKRYVKSLPTKKKAKIEVNGFTVAEGRTRKSIELSLVKIMFGNTTHELSKRPPFEFKLNSVRSLR